MMINPRTLIQTPIAPTRAPHAPERLTAPESSDGFSPAERRELESWNARLRGEMGALTTPPAGPVDPHMAKAVSYLNDLLDKVAGADITRSGIDLRVELFSGDVAQASLDDSMSMEREWRSRYPDEVWPIRRWMEIPDNHKDKPIYRLAIDVGMINGLETEDELAFVLAQQAERLLDHLKRDPDNEEVVDPATRSFVDSREMQTAADKAAVKRMSEAGFNPKAAFKALTALYSRHPIEYPDNDLQRALVAAAHDHEAEGMRLSAVQTEVESYVRRGEVSSTREMAPLPQDLKIAARPQYDKPVDNIEQFKADYRGLAEKLATDITPEWMFGSWGSGPREHYSIEQAGGDRQDKEEGLLAGVEHLDALQDKTAQQRVDGFLRLMLSLRNTAFPKEGFSSAAVSKFRSFMEKHGANWNADRFIDSLKREGQSLHSSFVDNVLYKQNFQEMSGGTLPNLAAAATRGWLTRTHAEPQPSFLPALIRKNHEGDRETWPLAHEMNEAALKALTAFDFTSMLHETGRSGHSKATEYANELFGLKDPDKDFMARLRRAGDDLAEKAGESRENRARTRLQLPLQEPKKLNSFLVALGESERWKEFSPEFDRDLRRQLADIATVSAQQPGFVDSEQETEAYPAGIERRFAEELKTSGSVAEGLTHLTRHLLSSQRIRAHSERREWLGEAAQTLAGFGVESVADQLATPDLSQHAETLRQALLGAYQLKPEELPNTETDSLKRLNERVKAKEFEPKREDYASDAEYYQAKQRYNERRRELRNSLKPISVLESRAVLSRMALLGHNKEISREFVKDMEVAHFEKILGGGEAALKRYNVTTSLYNAEDDESVGTDAGAFVMDGLLAVQSKIESLDQWYDLAHRTIEFSEGSTQARVGTRRKLGDNLSQRLRVLESEPLGQWLAKEKVLDLLSAEQSSDLLLKLLGEECGPNVPVEMLAERVAGIEKRYDLIEKQPVAYLEFRDKVAEKAKLQPDTVDRVFPEVVRGVTDTSEVYRRSARALSGLVAIAREKSPQEQLATIEYLMGRIDDMPAYLEDASEDQNFAPLRESLETTRQDLLDADSETRVLIANSFLAGPSGVLRTEAGKEAVISHFLKDLAPENLELADKIARGVLYSHGTADTLAVAYILGQHPPKPEEGKDPSEKGKLDEAAILNRLFDAYGVPGIKMKQYLAFTSEFKDFKEAFESAQDASMPLNYYQALKLVQKRFGDDWPKDLKIDRVLGSGSVNVAIRYTDEKSGKREVVSLGREDIVESTRYDFDRFNKLIEYMTQTEEDKEKYGYVLGLLGIINESVALEFKKEQAMEVQKMAYGTYLHENNGWQVRSIDAYKVENLGLFMEEAKGKTARKIYNENKELYNAAMDAMGAAEFGVLRGVDSTGNWKPRPLFANPDFHDGQVLIEKDSKMVTILDFGQAVPITNDDRVGGLDLLTVIAKADWNWLAAHRLNSRYFEGKKVITSEMLEPILAREDRMDCFIHLLSLLSRQGATVPISSVHWVLGLNRQMALAEKIGDPIDGAVKNMIANHKAGLPLSTFNASYGSGTKLASLKARAMEVAVQATRSVMGTVGGLFGLDLVAPTEAAQSEPKPMKQARYKAWRPNFT